MEWSRGVSRPLPDMQRLAADNNAAGLRSARPTSRYLRATGQLESDSSDDDGGVLMRRTLQKVDSAQQSGVGPSIWAQNLSLTLRERGDEGGRSESSYC